jgi:hypothetical protein
VADQSFASGHGCRYTSVIERVGSRGVMCVEDIVLRGGTTDRRRRGTCEGARRAVVTGVPSCSINNEQRTYTMQLNETNGHAGACASARVRRVLFSGQ